MKYKCGRCGYVFTLEEMTRTYDKMIRCPRCTYEIIYKVAKIYRITRAY